MAKIPYLPPKQSAFGQLFDTMFLLALVFIALFAPLYLQLAGGGKTTLTFTDTSWAGMGQNPTMVALWEKLGYTADTARDIIASRFDYSFNVPELAVTALVVIAYFFILVHFSKEEYREVISERFDKWGTHMTSLDSFHLLEYAAWAISILLGIYMLFDLMKTDRTYSEDLLTSSKEGEIDDALVIDPTHQGGRR